MNHTQLAEYAVACLEALDHPATLGDISRSGHMPYDACQTILDRFVRAGLARRNDTGTYERAKSMDSLTAFEVLQAVWSTPQPQTPSYTLLFPRENAGTASVLERALRVVAQPKG